MGSALLSSAPRVQGQDLKMTVTYTAYDKAAEFGSDAQEGYPLKAKTDRSARIEAKKIAAEKGWENLGISFFRDTDQCRGEIDA